MTLGARKNNMDLIIPLVTYIEGGNVQTKTHQHKRFCPPAVFMVTYSYMAHMPHIAHCTWKKTFDDKVCVIPPSAGIASCHQAVRINACQHWSDSNSMSMDDVSRCLKWQLDALFISYWNVQYWMCCFMIPTEARAAEENAQKQKHHMLQYIGAAEHSWTVVCKRFIPNARLHPDS